MDNLVEPGPYVHGTLSASCPARMAASLLAWQLSPRCSCVQADWRALYRVCLLARLLAASFVGPLAAAFCSLLLFMLGMTCCCLELLLLLSIRQCGLLLAAACCCCFNAGDVNACCRWLLLAAAAAFRWRLMLVAASSGCVLTCLRAVLLAWLVTC